jgi:uncharacterized protein YqcC (DUF446 family)
MKQHVEMASLLIDLEAVLRQQGLWQAAAPSPEALQSTQPFCIDTLEFPQWLQFVLLPRFQALVDVRAPLPPDCGIAPMAEVWAAEARFGASELVAVLRRIDAVCAAS